MNGSVYSGAAEALRIIRAQQHAAELVRRIKAGEIDADRLVGAVAPLCETELRALCRAIVKALQ